MNAPISKTSFSPVDLVNALQLAVVVGSFIKGQPTFDPTRFAGTAIRERRVGMQAWTLLVSPRTVDRFPGGDDPSHFVRRMTCHIGTGDHFIVVRLLLESLGAFQHRAHL